MTADINGRDITLAVLAEKIDSLSASVRQISKDHEDRIRTLEQLGIKHGERLGWWASAQAVLTLVASVIAGYIGVRNP